MAYAAAAATSWGGDGNALRNSSHRKRGESSCSSAHLTSIGLGSWNRSIDSKESRRHFDEVLRTAAMHREEKEDRIIQGVTGWLEREVSTQLKLLDWKMDQLCKEVREVPSGSRHKFRSHFAQLHVTSASRQALGDKECDRPIAKLAAAQQSPATSPREGINGVLQQVAQEGINGCLEQVAEDSKELEPELDNDVAIHFGMKNKSMSELDGPLTLTLDDESRQTSVEKPFEQKGSLPFDSRGSKGSLRSKNSKANSIVSWHEKVMDNGESGDSKSQKCSQSSASQKPSRRSLADSFALISADLPKLFMAATGSSPAGEDIEHTPSSNRLSFSAKAVWIAMEDSDSNQAARWYSNAMCVFILFTVVFSLLQMAKDSPIKGVPAAVIETTFDLVFLIDCLVRFVACPRKCKFLASYINVIDLLCCIPPLVFRICIGFVLPQIEDVDEERIWSSHTALLCVVPVLRLLKVIRHLRKFHLLIMSLKLCMEALPTLLYALGVLTLAFACIIYVVEPSDNIESLPKAIWLTMVTMTTVGYGDTIPKSTAGNVVVSMLVICSVLFMAMPLGIIGQAFNEIWKDRDRILVAKNTRERLVQWGYTARDIPRIFLSYSKDGSGELTFDEFYDMVTKLDIGLSDTRILELFQTFDGDDSGSVDAGEFIRILFPSDFLSMYRS